MIGKTRRWFSSLRSRSLSKEANQIPCGMLVSCHSLFRVPVHPSGWKGGWRNKPRSLNHGQNTKMHHDNAFNISMLSFLYAMLQFNYATFIHMFFSHSLNFSYLSLAILLNHHKKAPHFSSSPSLQHQEKRTIYAQQWSWWWSQHDTQ